MNISDRLVELIHSNRREARKCLRGKSYLGATVMEVAAFEAGLQAMCFLYPEEVKKTKVYAKQVKRGFRRNRSKALEFSLKQLRVVDEVIDVARSWLLHRIEKSLLRRMERDKKTSKTAQCTQLNT